MKIVAFSDTHGRRPWFNIPDGDVLVFAGDMTLHGRLDEVVKFNEFLGSLPHTHKLVIAGNHDMCFEAQPDESRARLSNAIYLQDESVTIQGVKFYGTPWQPIFRDMAFNLPRESLRVKWEHIPPETDVLITHTPPYGHHDRTFFGSRVGCRELLEAVGHIQPALHIFGHIHEAFGQSTNGRTVFANVSICNLFYIPMRRPVVFEGENCSGCRSFVVL
ncbi:MAG: metallophosphatase domain-containing protein [Chloroflexota bacterium]|nr:metallophosphatase domain-containing protein [Chloroflexota bacterium]MBI5704167.1 metallophosphatase domain-containing protein [Chloroflexota bacterium]